MTSCRTRCFIPLLAAMALLAAGVTCWAAPVPHSLESSYFSTSPAPQTDTRLGYSVAVGDQFTAVSAPQDDLGGLDSGVVRIYDTATGAFLHFLENPSPDRNDMFGSSIAISGQWLVIGAESDNTEETGAGSAYVYDLASATPALPYLVLPNPSPEAGDEFGAAVAVSGSRVVVGVPSDDVGNQDAGSAFVYDVLSPSPSSPIAILTAPGQPAGAEFGSAVGISGDVVIVSALEGEGGAADSGTVHVFDLTNPEPGDAIGELINPSPSVGGEFGKSISLSGSTAVIGMPGGDTGADNAGAAYVFNIVSPGVPISTLNNPSPLLNDSFGISVGISGNRIVIGANLDDAGAADVGTAYIYDTTSGTPSAPVATILNPAPLGGDEFGLGVAIFGNKAMVGAHKDNSVSIDAGSAYMYDLQPLQPALLYTITAASPLSDEEFGAAVAVSGTRVIVGSTHDDRGASNSGSVYLYDSASATPLVALGVIENPNPSVNDYFGSEIAVSGNLLVIAAFNDDVGANNSGTVYVYDISAGLPSAPVLTIHNPSPQSQDQFGSAVALSGTKLVVGVSQKDAGAPDSGSAMVFELGPPAPGTLIAVLENPSPTAEDLFGSAVGISGNKVVVGAYQDDAGAANAGSAYVYDLAAGPPYLPVHILNNPVPAAGDNFGYAVDISGNRVVAGSYRKILGAADKAGLAHVFDLTSGTPSAPVHTLTPPDPAEEGFFGYSVAIAGTRVIVGAPDANSGTFQRENCYIYELTSITPELPVETLENPGGTDVDDGFGYSVAIDGVEIAVGAPFQDGITENRGAAYAFDPDPPAPGVWVEEPPGNPLLGEGATINFGTIPFGQPGAYKPVLIRSVGTAQLEITAISITGGNAADFELTIPTIPASLAVDETLSFAITFTPAAAGSRVSTLQVFTNATGVDPVTVVLTGQAVSSEDDTDGDGLNDVAELQMESLGFDWQVNDEALVALLLSGANTLNLYSVSQLEDLAGGIKLIVKDPVSEDFEITVGLLKSTNLTSFAPLPMTVPETQINPQGELEFDFVSPEPKAFFRLEAR